MLVDRCSAIRSTRRGTTLLDYAPLATGKAQLAVRFPGAPAGESPSSSSASRTSRAAASGVASRWCRLALANGTDFGLVAGIYTRDVSRAFRFARAVDAGQVFINQYFAGGVETPFGGTKASGFGREKGLEALRAYFRVKTITARI